MPQYCVETHNSRVTVDCEYLQCADGDLQFMGKSADGVLVTTLVFAVGTWGLCTLVGGKSIQSIDAKD